MDFSDPLDAATATDAARYSVRVWNLKRSANYGSKHVDEHSLTVAAAEVVNAKSLRLAIPKLTPAMGIEIVCKLRQADGIETERVIHGTIHELAE